MIDEENQMDDQDANNFMVHALRQNQLKEVLKKVENVENFTEEEHAKFREELLAMLKSTLSGGVFAPSEEEEQRLKQIYVSAQIDGLHSDPEHPNLHDKGQEILNLVDPLVYPCLSLNKFKDEFDATYPAAKEKFIDAFGQTTFDFIDLNFLLPIKKVVTELDKHKDRTIPGEKLIAKYSIIRERLKHFSISFHNYPKEVWVRSYEHQFEDKFTYVD